MCRPQSSRDFEFGEHKVRMRMESEFGRNCFRPSERCLRTERMGLRRPVKWAQRRALKEQRQWILRGGGQSLVHCNRVRSSGSGCGRLASCEQGRVSLSTDQAVPCELQVVSLREECERLLLTGDELVLCWRTRTPARNVTAKLLVLTVRQRPLRCQNNSF